MYYNAFQASDVCYQSVDSQDESAGFIRATTPAPLFPLGITDANQQIGVKNTTDKQQKTRAGGKPPRVFVYRID
jgi:hypothetical protein